jgi:DNA gyrase inhibitor GyrI
MKKFPRARAILLFSAAALAILLLPQRTPAGAQGLQPIASRDKIVVQSKTVPAMRVLAQLHVGPYKKLGPVFADVANFARKRDVSGPFIGLYYDDSRRTPPDTQKAHVGIILSEPIVITEEDRPFELKELGPHQVAFARVQGPFRDVPKHYRAIHDWAWRNGYLNLHPVKEIYCKIQDEESKVIKH